MKFSIGQRWISHTEAKLGLGIVAEVSGRRVTVTFPAAGEDRTYATDNAPLARVRYQVGDHIQTLDETELEVTAVQEQQDLLYYEGVDEDGNKHHLSEVKLSCFVQFTTPQQRLFCGQFDNNPAYKLRVETLNHLARLQQSPAQGLIGARTSHLPHQVYIASEVAKRHAPRVLLADEVGLGKTIEAGLILHYQLQTGRASRALILVPETLIHQWLVEMLRRFNLHFAIFDEARYQAMLESEPDYELDENDQPVLIESENDNPFEAEQLILCSLDFLTNNAQARAHAAEAGWDIVVVDEAHHLRWSPDEASEEYQCVEQLSQHSKGLLLLTATPEQVGLESHFARLRLLDPARFHDLETFRQEEANYQQLNELVQELLQQEGPLSSAQLEKLNPYLGEEAQETIDTDQLIRKLLDRHGTGRVLFRNTRAAIQGFPERQLQPSPLPCPELYPAEHRFGTQGLYPEVGLNPEDWVEQDPRVAWLQTLLKSVKPAKVLVICAHAETAIALEQHLQLRAGIRTAAFYEGLSIIERDRAAAYFAEQEQGAQALVCSEIGSEGRNFQFAHHLVLFDLPLNPDLLEQRIGRLDRIGQKEAIQIHVPYLEGTAQEILFRWYQEGLDAFATSNAVGVAVYESVADQLMQQLQAPDANLDALIAQTATQTQELRQRLQSGRDRLLEMNSCNRPQAEALIAQIEAEENTPELQEYMERVWDLHGVAHELHSQDALVLRPSEQMTSHFPKLRDEGNTVTFNRTLALSREDMDFLSWEHPMVTEAMDMILSTELGNAALATMSVKGINPGTLLLEAIFSVQYAAPKFLQLERFLPSKPIRVLVDVSGKNLTPLLSHEQLNELCQDIKRRTGQAIVAQVRTEAEKMVLHAQRYASAELPAILKQAIERMEESLNGEVQRLEALQRINPSIRDEEIEFFRNQIRESSAAIARASMQLQALRIVIST